MTPDREGLATMRLPNRTLTTVTVSLAALGLMTGCTAPDPSVEVRSSTQSAPAQEIRTPATAAPAAPTTSPSAASSSPASAGGAGDTGDTVVLGRDDDYSIEESGLTISITCEDGGDISVDADEVDLSVTGSCEDIDVDGNGNGITAEDADEFDVDGDSNSLTGNVVREVTVDGDSNTIAVQSTDEVEVDGSQNSVTHAEGDPRIDGDDDDADDTNSITRG